MTTVMDEMLKRNGLAALSEGEDADIANGDSFSISIEVDDILSAYGSTLTAYDIFKQIGDLSFIYSSLVHPVIAELYNGTEQMDRLNNIYKDNEIADYIYDSIESKIFLVVDSLRDTSRITVETKDVTQLCTVIIDMLVSHIRSLIDDQSRQAPNSNVPVEINILEKARATLLPTPRDPRLLNIVLEYYWVHY